MKAFLGESPNRGVFGKLIEQRKSMEVSMRKKEYKGRCEKRILQKCNPGSEPYCPTEWKPIDVQTAWYEENGFHVDHLVSGATPCMMKKL